MLALSAPCWSRFLGNERSLYTGVVIVTPGGLQVCTDWFMGGSSAVHVGSRRIRSASPWLRAPLFDVLFPTLVGALAR